MKRLLLCLALQAVWTMSPVLAAPIDDVHEPVPGLPGRIWLDLIRQAVLDAKPAEPPRYGLIGHNGASLRWLFDGESNSDWDETINIAGLTAEAFEVGGRKRIILALDLEGADIAPLALFEGEGAGRLLDAIDARTDVHTSYEEPMTKLLGRDAALVVSKGWHSNSSQSYRIDSLIMIAPEKFSFIGDIFVYGDNDCRSQVSEKETITLVPTEPLAEIQVSVTHHLAKLRSDCSTVVGKPQVKIARGSFTWDAAKNAYVGKTEQLDWLAKENEKRF